MARTVFGASSRRLALAPFFSIALITLGGCTTISDDAALNPAPSIATVSQPNDALRRVPMPAEKTVVAVYEYNDLTGQYKERENVQTLSRAVTQGGAPVLVKALQDAGEGRWFTVLERAELDNLLRERQILTEMRRLYRNETQLDAGVLPPLLHASIIVEGGIIGYDTNTITGGAGARFLGIGADTRYQQDTVTVTLRAVSTKTGEVLTTVTARKAVASYALQGGAFRYLKLDELLEAEAGVTYNEPKQIAVESAIEEAVRALIVEGATLGVWTFADQTQGAEYIAAYRDKKYQDNLTLAAETPQPPRTKDANSIADTIARAPRPVRQASAAPVRAAPAQAGAPVQSTPVRRLPPPPADEEILGDALPGVRVPDADKEKELASVQG